MDKETNRKTQRLKGVADHLTLGMIDRRPMYGFEILQELKSMDEIGMSEGTVYPVLGRLVDQGLLESYESRPENPPRRKRRYYTPTACGQATLHQWNREWIDFLSRVERILRCG